MKRTSRGWGDLLKTLLILAFAPLAGQTTDPLYESYFQSETAGLPGRRTRLFNTAALAGFRLTADDAKATMRKIPVAGMPFGIAFRFEVEQPGPNSWDPQFMTAVNTSAVSKDDVLLYIFYSRTAASSDPSGRGKVSALAQISRSPWTGLANHTVLLDSSWRRTVFSARTARDYAAGEIEATFHLGYFPQIVDIGGVIALNLGPVNEDLLPVYPITYRGRESGASWRAAAEERIDRFRKADVTVRVTDMLGNPIEGAEVRIRMKRHAFGFGTFNPALALPNPSDMSRYRTALFKYFNKVTTPFYWGDSTGTWGWELADYRKYCMDLAAWNRANGFRIRGHNLVWPGWQWLPPRIHGLAADTAALRRTVLAHVREVVEAALPYDLEEWDVVNEPYINHDLMDLLGDQAIAEWFEAAHAVDPRPSLVINETGDITAGGNAAALDRLDGLAEFLLGRGAPLGGLGFQAHFGGDLTDIPVVLDIFNRFARFGLPLRITEFDIDTRDLQAQADYTRDLLTAVFSHPSMDSFVQWGFWEGDHWRPNGAMIRRDWTLKPNALVYDSLVLGAWWTDVSGRTDRQGWFSARGFLGWHVATATYGTAGDSMEFMLGSRGFPVRFSLRDSTTTGRLVVARPFPNPFRRAVTLGLQTPNPCRIRVDILDAAGRVVRPLYKGSIAAGTIRFRWDGTDAGDRPVPSGCYEFRIRADSPDHSWTEVRKVTRLK